MKVLLIVSLRSDDRARALGPGPCATRWPKLHQKNNEELHVPSFENEAGSLQCATCLSWEGRATSACRIVSRGVGWASSCLRMVDDV